MIRLSDINGNHIYLKEAEIEAIIENPGIHTNSFVISKGTKYEVRERAEQIYKQIKEAETLRKE